MAHMWSISIEEINAKYLQFSIVLNAKNSPELKKYLGVALSLRTIIRQYLGIPRINIGVNLFHTLVK